LGPGLGLRPNRDDIECVGRAPATRLTVIEQRLADGREFLTAGRFTLADLSLGFVVTLAGVVGLGDLVTPNVAAYRDRLRARPAYRRVYGPEKP